MDENLRFETNSLLKALIAEVSTLISGNKLFEYNNGVFNELSDNEIIYLIDNDLKDRIYIYSDKDSKYIHVEEYIKNEFKINFEDVLIDEVFYFILGNTFINTYKKLFDTLNSIKELKYLIDKRVEKDNINNAINRLLEINKLINLFLTYNYEYEKFVNDDKYDDIDYVSYIKKITLQEAVKISLQWKSIVSEHAGLMEFMTEETARISLQCKQISDEHAKLLKIINEYTC